MSGHADHAVSLRTYFAVFIALILFTMITYQAAFMDFGNHVLNVIVAMVIAMTKAALVILFFMHVKYSRRLIWVFVSCGFIWLALLIVGTLHDYVSRGWLG